MKTSSRWISWVAVGALVLTPTAGSAQGLVPVGERGSFGAAAILLRPVGEFQQFVGWGGGLNLFGVVGLGRGSALGIRMDGTFLVYGTETVTVPFSRTVPRVSLDMNTTNSIASLGVGPQLRFGHGLLTAYVYGLAGFSYFATVSSVEDRFADPVASTTNFDDATLSLTGGGGVRLRLANGRKPVALDLGVSATRNGEVDYLRRGSIVDRPDGSLLLVPIRSEADLVVFKLGVSVSVF